MENDKEFMTATEVARALHVGRTTLQRLIEKGVVTPVNEPNPFISKPKALKFDRATVEELARNPPPKPVKKPSK